MAQSGFRDTVEDNCVTSIHYSEFFYTWTINDFSVWMETVEGEQHSPKFPSGDHEKIQWFLRFYPTSIKHNECCSLFVGLASSPKNKLNCTVEIALHVASGDLIVQKSNKHEFQVNEVSGWSNIIERKILLERVKPMSDKLIIKCKLITKSIVNETPVKPAKPLPSRLSKDLKILLADGDKFSDVTILVAGQRFLAHKSILSARSSVFNAMFQNQMQESIENCVSIDDVEPPVFKALLRYIYTDEVTGLEGTLAHDLYKAADKYDLLTLKSHCRYHILEKLSYETGAETLILADLHGDLEMKKHVQQFLSGSVAAAIVTETDGWKKLVRAYPHLVDETFKALTSKAIISTQKLLNSYLLSSYKRRNL